MSPRTPAAPGDGNRVYFINVSELTVIRFLILALLGRPVFIVNVEALFPPLQRCLDLTARAIRRLGRAQRLFDTVPELYHCAEAGSEVYLYNIFAKIEPWMNGYFDFAGADEKTPDYAMAYKATVCDFMRLKFLPVLILDSVLRKPRAAPVSFVGIRGATRGALAVYSGQPRPQITGPRLKGLSFVLNALSSLLIASYAVAWILSRTRPFGLQARRLFLMLDYVPRFYNHLLYRELHDVPSLMLVVRTAPHNQQEAERIGPYDKCNPKDGRLALGDALRAIGLVLRDTTRLFRHYHGLDSDVFFRIAKLPFKRIVLKALFSRYRPEFYFGRDEDTPDHILRRQELNRIGSKSYGNLHGFPTYANLRATFRYISYDRFYVIGQAICTYYRDTWASDMALVPVGSHGASREDYAMIGAPRPSDIGIFISVYTGEPALVRLIREVADAFPDRTLWLQLKPNYAARERGRAFVRECRSGRPNIRYTEDSPFSIIRRVRFALSDSSTAVMEALQFGVVTFMTDVSEKHEDCIYRNYPDLCIRTGSEAVARIQAVEAGKWRYPRETFDDLVHLSETPFADVLKADLGLAPASSPAIPEQPLAAGFHV